MSKALTRVAGTCAILLIALIANLTYIQIFKADEYRSASGNARSILQEYSRDRGPILVGREAVAKSIETGSDLKYLRRYSNGPLFAPATGFYSLVYGATGIERAENSVLAGTDGRLLFDRLQQLIAGRDPKGGLVSLGLDAGAQKAAFEGLAGRKGAVVAIQPRTGKILALVQSPSFDPNELSSNDSAAIQRYYKQLTRDPEEPLLNRPLASSSPPGSTFKIVTAAAALESGQFTPQSVIPGPARYTLPGTTTQLRNASGTACGPGGEVTLTEALVVSCNTAFAWLANQLGDDAIRQQAERFGFGTSFEVPMPAAAGRYPSDLDEAQTALSGIGQFDVRATALNMAQVVAGVAQAGAVMYPYLVTEISSPDNTVLDTTAPETFGQAITATTAQQLTEMMVQVVDRGTGSNGSISGVRVAGKTGTAENGENQPNTVWFTSFAPAASPEVAVAVVLEKSGGSGNALAAPIARAVMESVLGR